MTWNRAAPTEEEGMRFGVKTAPQHTTWPAMLDVWRTADDIDVFESAWNFDHFYPIFSDSTGPCLEGWTMLGAMAAATRRIRIGCQVTGMPYRHPAVLANMAATVDVISDGRLELGLGAGWNDEEADAYGIDLPPLRERFDRFDEGVEAIIRLLSDTGTTFAGSWVRLEQARCEPKPVQRPHPPVCIGGNGRTRTLRTAARFAQHWNSLIGSPADWVELHEVLAGHCAEIGRDPGEVTCSVNLWYDPRSGTGPIAEQAAGFAEVGVDVAVVYLPTPHDASVLEPIAEAVSPLLDA
jgi:F420-dependent oxidoreductase-like protein